MAQKNSAKRDFGSFHSSNVEELIYQEEHDYKPPKLIIPFETEKYICQNLSSKFGTDELKHTLFYLNDEFSFLNHGAFGLSFKPVVEYVNQWKAYAESQPLRFYDRQIIPLLVDLIRNFSNLLKCKPNELVLVDNCTYAFNSIINSIKLNQGDEVFIFSTTYGAFKKIFRGVCQEAKAYLIEETVEFPILNQTELEKQTLEKMQKVLEKDKIDRKIKVIFVDHIPSNQPFKIPIQKLSNYCSENRPDILFVVDAAHSLGSTKEFNMQNLKGVDILFTNCHKWFCGPKGTALLFRSENAKNKINLRPVVQSHGINSGFNSEFAWSGLKDYSTFLGLYGNLEIWQKCLGGFENVINYCDSLAKEASMYLRNFWSTGYLVDPSLCSTMVCVKLPEKFIQKVVRNSKLTYDQAEMVQNFFYFNYSIEVPVKCVQGELYVRISAHLYNKLQDYGKLAQVVLENSN